MGLVERHVDFVEALRRAGVPVSLAEDLDAVRAVTTVGLGDREALRAAYAATVVKRPVHRAAFDTLFDLWFPATRGGPRVPGEDADETAGEAGDDAGEQPPSVPDDGAALADFRDRLAAELEEASEARLAELASEAVGRFGPVRGRGPGQQAWSAYSVMSRVQPDQLVEQLLEGLRAALGEGLDSAVAERTVRAALARFTALVEAEVRRLTAEERGEEHVAKHAVRPSIEQVDFLRARREDLEAMRREIYPLARRLATRLAREHHHARRGALDFRRTVRASVGTGGVPVVTHHRPRRSHKPELVVLCDVSGSVAPFAQFTLGLVFALREQFTKVRAFTFIDDVAEVTDVFRPGADLGETMAELAASARYAALWGRTSYGRAFTRFTTEYPDAIGPRTSLLILGDARSNYGDLGLPHLRTMVDAAKHAWLINPEARLMWNTGDSAVDAFAEILPVAECRNLAQLSEFVHELA
ncbi:MAG TPA: VWA domain-containing protein [Microthrixaceae bacterium]|nr:VWA domain-containing protein [Microthrixaceae bacterium]